MTVNDQEATRDANEKDRRGAQDHVTWHLAKKRHLAKKVDATTSGDVRDI